VKSASKRNFFLDKTYLDCVDDAGNCFIFYSATMKFLFLKFNYSGYIFSDENNHVTTYQSYFHKSAINSENQGLGFSNAHFKIRGYWGKSDNQLESLLYRNASGIVSWNCHHPLSKCNITFQNHQFSGLGYAETLSLSIKPWELPIDELKWGRFLAAGIVIIWIQWLGEYPVNKIYMNGIEFNDATFASETVIFNGMKNRLTFSDSSVIRQARFSDHLSNVPWFKILINKAILSSLESKYKSKTIFEDGSGEIHHGWSIFEVVKWEH
jgi:hypothetical protein